LQLAVSLARREGGSDVERHLARIANEADRLEQLIARTLKLVRLGRPVVAEPGVPVDIGQLLKSIADDVAIEADARDCTLTLENEGGLEVLGDAELLRSAFENVIRNAVRYGASGKRVAVTARRGEAPLAIEVTVRDHGPGVPEKDLELIFEPFYRVDAARNRSGGGDGLGLAIAARAIERHGGTITARNAPGGGLEVAMRLPTSGTEPVRSVAGAAEAA
jgi:two-component system sensor histidine kinase CpxA